MEELNFDNILDENAIDLFNDSIEETTPTEEKSEENTEEVKKPKETTEVNPDTLFEGEEPESVGSEENQAKENAPLEGSSSSPAFYSSIAEALNEEGILQLDSDKIKEIKTSDDLKEAFKSYIESELSEKQRRIEDALNNNVEPEAVREYERTKEFLDGIDEEFLNREDDQASKVRANLIYQDYINRGFSQEKATKMTKKSIEEGNDIEDARDAVESLKEFVENRYNNYLQERKNQTQQYEESLKKKVNQMKETILNGKNEFISELEISKEDRQRIYDNLYKPTYKDKDTGRYITAMQKYAKENTDEWNVKLGVLFTLTDGFKSLDKLINKKVNKRVKKGLANLESKINNTARDSNGFLDFISGTSDEESYLGNGIKLDL